MARRIFLSLYFWSIFFLTSMCFSQVFQQKSSMNFGAEFSCQIWKAGKDKISEFTFPVMYIYPLNKKCQLYSICTPLYSTLSTGFNYHLSSISDIKLGGKLFILNNRWTLTFGLNFPLGRNRLNSKERQTAQVLAIPAFNFRAPDPGQGFNIQVGICSARRFDNFLIGWGVGVILRGGYNPFFESSGIYNPGDELCVNIGVKAGGWKGDLLFIANGSDTWESKRHLKPGNRIIMQLQYFQQINRMNFTFIIINRIKTKDTLFSDSVVLPQKIVANSGQFEIRSILGFELLNGNLLRGIFNIKHCSNSQFDTGGASMIGIGIGGDFKIFPNLWYRGEVSYFAGNILINDRKVNANGFDLRGGIEINF